MAGWRDRASSSPDELPFVAPAKEKQASWRDRASLNPYGSGDLNAQLKTQDEINKARDDEYARNNPDVDIGYLDAGRTKFVQGFLKGYDDEFDALAETGNLGDEYRRRRDENRRRQDMADQKLGGVGTGLEVLGDVGSDVLLHAAGVPVESPVYQALAGGASALGNSRAELTPDKITPESAGQAAVETGFGTGVGYAYGKYGAPLSRAILGKPGRMIQESGEKQVKQILDPLTGEYVDANKRAKGEAYQQVARENDRAVTSDLNTQERARVDARKGLEREAEQALADYEKLQKQIVDLRDSLKLSAESEIAKKQSAAEQALARRDRASKVAALKQLESQAAESERAVAQKQNAALAAKDYALTQVAKEQSSTNAKALGQEESVRTKMYNALIAGKDGRPQNQSKIQTELDKLLQEESGLEASKTGTIGQGYQSLDQAANLYEKDVDLSKLSDTARANLEHVKSRRPEIMERRFSEPLPEVKAEQQIKAAREEIAAKRARLTAQLEAEVQDNGGDLQKAAEKLKNVPDVDPAMLDDIVVTRVQKGRAAGAFEEPDVRTVDQLRGEAETLAQDPKWLEPRKPGLLRKMRAAVPEKPEISRAAVANKGEELMSRRRDLGIYEDVKLLSPDERQAELERMLADPDYYNRRPKERTKFDDLQAALNAAVEKRDPAPLTKDAIDVRARAELDRLQQLGEYKPAKELSIDEREVLASELFADPEWLRVKNPSLYEKLKKFGPNPSEADFASMLSKETPPEALLEGLIGGNPIGRAVKTGTRMLTGSKSPAGRYTAATKTRARGAALDKYMGDLGGAARSALASQSEESMYETVDEQQAKIRAFLKMLKEE